MVRHETFKNVFAAAAIGLSMSSLSFADDCVRVNPPPLPEATLVTANQMAKTQMAVKAYVEANTLYLSCANSTNKKNRAFKEIKKVAKAYNKLLSIYQARVAAGDADQGGVSVVAMQ